MKPPKKERPLTPKQLKALAVLQLHQQFLVATRVGGLQVCEALEGRGLVVAGPLVKSAMAITTKGTFVTLTASYKITEKGTEALWLSGVPLPSTPLPIVA